MEIVVKKNIIEGRGICDFCELKKEGFLGKPTKDKSSFYGIKYEDTRCELTAILNVHKHFQPSLFGTHKYVIPSNECTYKYLVKEDALKFHEVETTSSAPLICRSCITEIYKQLK